MCLVGSDWYYGHLLEEEVGDYLPFHWSVMYDVIRSVFSLPLGIIGRLSSVVVAFSGFLFSLFSIFAN